MSKEEMGLVGRVLYIILDFGKGVESRGGFLSRRGM